MDVTYLYNKCENLEDDPRSAKSVIPSPTVDHVTYPYERDG